MEAARVRHEELLAAEEANIQQRRHKAFLAAVDDRWAAVQARNEQSLAILAEAVETQQRRHEEVLAAEAAEIQQPRHKEVVAVEANSDALVEESDDAVF